jgi:hypothetical protein
MDGDDPQPYVSKLFNEPATIWDATKITAFPDGKWVLFLDMAHEGRLLNSRRLQNVDLKIPYRHRGYRPREPLPVPDPLAIPKIDNYTSFRARRRIYAARDIQSARGRDAMGSEFEEPREIYSHSFHGDDPSRHPFRRSIQLVNERRLHDARPEAPRIHSRVVRGSRPSLFQRSITIKKKQTVWPPDDYFEWNCSDAERE